MIDPVKILKRAWYILWDYRTLWVFGLLIALGSGGGGNGGGGNSGYQFDRDEWNGNFRWDGRFDREFQEFIGPLNRMTENEIITILIWIGIGLLCFFLLVGIVFAIGRFISETAVIRMVNDLEESGEKVGFRRGWRFGWSLASWRLFLINLLVNLPAFMLLAALFILGVLVFLIVRDGGRIASVITGIVGGIWILLLLALIVFLIEIVLNLLREFFWRVCVLQNKGVLESLQIGFGLARRQWKNTGLMWLVMLGMGIIWFFAFILLFFLLIPLYIVLTIPAILVAGTLGLVVFGITNLFIPLPFAVMVALIVSLPPFFIIVFLPLALLEALEKVFTSSVWTLTYRDMLSLDNPAPANVGSEPA